MTTNRDSISWGFFLMWLFTTLIAFAIGLVIFFVIMSVLGESIGVIPNFVASLMMAICFGSIIGFTQWVILRRNVPISATWIGITFLGFLLCSPVLLSMSGGFGPYITPLNSLGMTATLGGILGIAQWFTINKKIRQSTLWIGICLIAWILAGLTGIVLKSLSWQMGPMLYWLGLFLIGTVLSVVGMMWLHKQTRII